MKNYSDGRPDGPLYTYTSYVMLILIKLQIHFEKQCMAIVYFSTKFFREHVVYADVVWAGSECGSCGWSAWLSSRQMLLWWIHQQSGNFQENNENRCHPDCWVVYFTQDIQTQQRIIICCKHKHYSNRQKPLSMCYKLKLLEKPILWLFRFRVCHHFENLWQKTTLD